MFSNMCARTHPRVLLTVIVLTNPNIAVQTPAITDDCVKRTIILSVLQSHQKRKYSAKDKSSSLRDTGPLSPEQNDHSHRNNRVDDGDDDRWCQSQSLELSRARDFCIHE